MRVNAVIKGERRQDNKRQRHDLEYWKNGDPEALDDNEGKRKIVPGRKEVTYPGSSGCRWPGWGGLRQGGKERSARNKLLNLKVEISGNR